MEDRQKKKKDGGNWAVQFIVAFMVVFLLSGVIANWDTIKAGYNKGKEEKDTTQGVNPEEERVHPDALIVENMQIANHRIEQKFNASMLNAESTIEQLEDVLSDLLSFKSELLEFKKLAKSPDTFDLIDTMITNILEKQKQVNQAITQLQDIKEE